MNDDSDYDGVEEQRPMQPACPHIYVGLPEKHPIKVWFTRRGWIFKNGVAIRTKLISEVNYDD